MFRYVIMFLKLFFSSFLAVLNSNSFCAYSLLAHFSSIFFFLGSKGNLWCSPSEFWRVKCQWRSAEVLFSGWFVAVFLIVGLCTVVVHTGRTFIVSCRHLHMYTVVLLKFFSFMCKFFGLYCHFRCFFEFSDLFFLLISFFWFAHAIHMLEVRSLTSYCWLHQTSSAQVKSLLIRWSISGIVWEYTSLFDSWDRRDL